MLSGAQGGYDDLCRWGIGRNDFSHQELAFRMREEQAEAYLLAGLSLVGLLGYLICVSIYYLTH